MMTSLGEAARGASLNKFKSWKGTESRVLSQIYSKTFQIFVGFRRVFQFIFGSLCISWIKKFIMFHLHFVNSHFAIESTPCSTENLSASAGASTPRFSVSAVKVRSLGPSACQHFMTRKGTTQMLEDKPGYPIPNTRSRLYLLYFTFNLYIIVF